MSKVSFETPTLADVLKAASSVAPTRGDGFDQLAGLLLEIEPTQCVVRATDAQVFYTQVISCDADGSFVWRIPSAVVATTVSKLSMASGSRVTFSDEAKPTRVTITSARTTIEVPKLNPANFPSWDVLPTEDMQVITEIGAKIKAVMWASATDDPALNGVMVYPDGFSATNRARMARVEATTGDDSEAPYMIPARTLSRVVPDNGEVGIAKVGSAFVIQPDAQTQIRTTVVESNLLDVRVPLKRKMELRSTFNKDAFLGCLGRALDFTGGNRQARLSLYIGDGEIALYMNNEEIGLIGDIVDCEGSADSHGRIRIEFNPTNVRDCINNFPGQEVVMEYDFPILNEDTGKKRSKPVRFVNPTGTYTSMLAPLQEPKGADL